ncbi:MAG TPA: glycosyltransferase family 2 protein [Pirellulaceae bacterium]|nr:glycosyltransferase family 2 protein [Pirellulaceae bacterium]
MTKSTAIANDSELAASRGPVSTPTRGDNAAIDRAIDTLDRLESLTELLAVEEGYEPVTLDYPLPPKFKLSVVIPVYNEERTIRRVIARVNSLPIPKEIVVVNDASTDRTADVLDELDGRAGLHVIHKPQNEGKGAALRTGFRHAGGDVIVVQDADLEYDPRDIVSVIRPIVEGQSDVVFGSRFLGEEPQDRSLVHRTGNWFLTASSNWLTGLELTDMETCYKAFRRDILAKIEIQQNRFGFEPEVTAKLARLKVRITEVPIRYQARGYADGKKIGIKDLFNAVWCIVRYGWFSS